MTDRAKALHAYLDRARSKPFRAGQHDCALFVAGWVKIATGVDHARGWRGKYRSIKKGRDLLRQMGHDDHVSMAAHLLSEVPPSMAQTGDLAVIEGNALGIVADERVFVLGIDGLGHVSRRRAERAFSV